MMRRTTFACACLLLFAACSARRVAAQTPTPPISVIKMGGKSTGGGGTGGNNSGSSLNNSTAPGQKGAGSTLICRMGGEMRWSLVSQFDVVQTQLNGKSVRVPVVQALFDQLLYAKGGAAKADGSGLQPGQCGWAERPLSASDPDRVIAEVNDFMLRQNVLWGNGSTIRSEAVVFGGALSFQNKQVFSMQVAPLDGKQFKVVAGTYPKALSK